MEQRMYRNPNSAARVRKLRTRSAKENGYRNGRPRNSQTPRDMWDIYGENFPNYPAIWGKYRAARRQGLPAYLAFYEAQGDGLMRVLAAAQRQSRDDFKVGKGVFPSPVYVATSKSGRIMRTSFWSRVGKPIDFAAGYNVAMLLGRAIPISGHVEHNGVVIADPHFAPTVAPTKARKESAAKRLRDICRALNEGEIDAAIKMAAAA